MDNLIPQILLSALLFSYPAWRIYKRAGLNPAYSLIVIIPAFGLLIAGVVLSVSTWKLNSIDGDS